VKQEITLTYLKLKVCVYKGCRPAGWLARRVPQFRTRV
jgi:hypothetical protein